MNKSFGFFLGALALVSLSACDNPPPRETAKTPPAAPVNDKNAASATQSKFVPPPESAIPKNEYGEMILLGKNIFVHTQEYAKNYVGNGLSCANCHLDNGRKADSAPLWAAYVLYPAYRKKTGQVDTLQSRIQGCFRYSMNGTPPAADSTEMTALITYHYWLANGAPTGVKLPGQGFVKVPKPPQKPDLARGEQVYKNNCVICHGTNGEGMKANGKFAFPPLWGSDSFNWGAGMHRVDILAGFVKANMPYGRGGSLSDQEAWDVAMFVASHDRPQDPRFEGTLAHTRDKYHDEYCLYGRTPAELEILLVKQTTSAASAANPIGGTIAAAPFDGASPATSH